MHSYSELADFKLKQVQSRCTRLCTEMGISARQLLHSKDVAICMARGRLYHSVAQDLELGFEDIEQIITSLWLVRDMAA